MNNWYKHTTNLLRDAIEIEWLPVQLMQYTQQIITDRTQQIAWIIATEVLTIYFQLWTLSNKLEKIILHTLKFISKPNYSKYVDLIQIMAVSSTKLTYTGEDWFVTVVQLYLYGV